MHQLPTERGSGRCPMADSARIQVPSTIGKSWGQMPECHNNQTMPTDPITEESDDTDIRQYVKKRKARPMDCPIRDVVLLRGVRAGVLWVVHKTDFTVQLAGNSICCVVRGLFHCADCSRCATVCCRYQGMLLALPRRPDTQDLAKPNSRVPLHGYPAQIRAVVQREGVEGILCPRVPQERWRPNRFGLRARDHLQRSHSISACKGS